MTDIYVTSVNEAVAYIQAQIHDDSFKPKIAITLGSGLDKLAGLIQPIAEIAYTDIPHFPHPTVVGHEGKLIAGILEDVAVIGYKGRKHYYEIAHEPDALDQIVFPVHVAASLGCELYIATNAAGGLNPRFRVGDLMVIRSHIGLFVPNPLLGAPHNFNHTDYFQSQSDIYPQTLREMFEAGSPEIREGVYAAVTGRTYESQAECLALRILGADAVGMSTVPEIIVAANRGMKTLGISTITNVVSRDGTNATNHEEVIAVLNSPTTEAKLFDAYRHFFKLFSAS